MDKRVTTTVLFEAARLSAELDAGATLKFYRPDVPRGIRYVLRNCTDEDSRLGQATRVLSHVASGLLCEVTRPAALTPMEHRIDYAALERSVLERASPACSNMARTHTTKREPLTSTGIRALRGKTLIWPNGLTGLVGGSTYRWGYGLCLYVYHNGRTSSQRPSVYNVQHLADQGVRCLVEGSESGESTPCWRDSVTAVRPLSAELMAGLIGHELHWPGGAVRVCTGLSQVNAAACAVVRPLAHDGYVSLAKSSEEYYSAQRLADERVVCKLCGGSNASTVIECWVGAGANPSKPITLARDPLDDAAMHRLAGKLLVWPCGDSRLCVGVARMYGGVCAKLAQADGMEPRKAMNARELAAASVQWSKVAGSQLHPCWDYT